MRQKLVILSSILLIASLILAACQPVEKPATGSTTVPGTEVEVVSTVAPQTGSNITPEFKNPDTLMVITGAGRQETMDPAYMYDTASTTIHLNIYEGLVFFDKERTDKFIPALATDLDSQFRWHRICFQYSKKCEVP